MLELERDEGSQKRGPGHRFRSVFGALLLATISGLCRRWGSNPHSFRNRFLRPARLPFRHFGKGAGRGSCNACIIGNAVSQRQATDEAAEPAGVTASERPRRIVSGRESVPRQYHEPIGERRATPACGSRSDADEFKVQAPREAEAFARGEDTAAHGVRTGACVTQIGMQPG